MSARQRRRRRPSSTTAAERRAPQLLFLACIDSRVLQKVLLIDEAYALNDGTYGREALDTIVSKVAQTVEQVVFDPLYFSRSNGEA
jgi:hypothetical protein